MGRTLRVGTWGVLSAVGALITIIICLILGDLYLIGLVLGFSWAVGALWVLVRESRAKRVWRALFFYIASLGGIIMAFGVVYAAVGLLPTDSSASQPLIKEITTGIYFSAVTWATLGYGDLRPIIGTRWIAAFESLIGYIYMGLLVSLIYHALTPKHKQ